MGDERMKSGFKDSLQQKKSLLSLRVFLRAIKMTQLITFNQVGIDSTPIAKKSKSLSWEHKLYLPML